MLAKHSRLTVFSIQPSQSHPLHLSRLLNAYLYLGLGVELGIIEDVVSYLGLIVGQLFF